MNKCMKCGSQTANPKFCSRSCSASVTNRTAPKRSVEPQNLCNGCGKRLSRRKGSRKTQLCKTCMGSKLSVLDGVTKAEACAISRSWGAKNSEAIRQHAKRLARKFGIDMARCESCGNHGRTDLCHLRAIKDFPPEAPVLEINSRDNLAAMCTPCHRLHDTDMLRLLRERP